MTNPESLEKITEMAAALMLPEEIAILLDFPVERFCYLVASKPDSPQHIAFMKGRLQTKFELRKKVVSLAKVGSPQAELLYDKYLNNE